ncbi:DNA replication/repair protein RecF [bacterium]|nr:DNA replication/repair protein RecF [bacterium]
MHLGKISLSNFRNYDNVELCFSPNLNIIYGRNAQGKTNLLEAIYLVCLGRSFRLATNEELLKAGTEALLLDGDINLDNEVQKRVVLQYKREGKKEISIDLKRLKSHAALFGNFPAIVMSPDDYRITTGGPAERRRFIDVLLSQLSLSYLTDLQQYHRVLKQRNRILQSLKEGRSVSNATIEPWTNNLIQVGSKILTKRFEFIKKFMPLVDSVYKEYSESQDSLSLSIESTVLVANGSSVEESFLGALELSRSKEWIVGRTVIGPHRDDLVFKINDKDLRKYGSRGEHKSVLISLKFAEFDILKEMKQETPIFLLDDYRSELDGFREEKVFSSLQRLGQIFLTSPTEAILTKERQNLGGFIQVSTFRVQGGSVERVN